MEAFAAGTLALPNNAKLAKDVPEDLIEPLPALPKMNLLVVAGPEKNKLFIPSTLVKRWQFHEQFGKEFVAWLDDFSASHAILDDTNTVPAPNPGQKRGKDDNGEDTSPNKKSSISG